jgi:hypothetical protein
MRTPYFSSYRREKLNRKKTAAIIILGKSKISPKITIARAVKAHIPRVKVIWTKNASFTAAAVAVAVAAAVGKFIINKIFQIFTHLKN